MSAHVTGRNKFDILWIVGDVTEQQTVSSTCHGIMSIIVNTNLATLTAGIDATEASDTWEWVSVACLDGPQQALLTNDEASDMIDGLMDKLTQGNNNAFEKMPMFPAIRKKRVLH